MKRKIYEPVREFERQTSYCPLYLAWRIVDEARDYFRTSWVPSPGSAALSHRMGEGLANKLARRAEAVFAHHPLWARKATPRAGSQQQFQCWRQREFILKFMRHWLASVLAKENPLLFRQLPESFKIGMPLPSSDLRPPSPIRWAKDMPEKMVGTPRCGVQTSRRDVPTDLRTRRNVPTKPRFVHGCELLPA
jgi:hypothetical protein